MLEITENTGKKLEEKIRKVSIVYLPRNYFIHTFCTLEICVYDVYAFFFKSEGM